MFAEETRFFGEATLGLSSQLTKAARRKTALHYPCSLRETDRSLIWTSWTTGFAAKKHENLCALCAFLWLRGRDHGHCS
jgi:hypothetical protein